MTPVGRADPLRDDLFVHRVSRRAVLRKAFGDLVMIAILVADVGWVLVVDPEYPLPLPMAINLFVVLALAYLRGGACHRA